MDLLRIVKYCILKAKSSKIYTGNKVWKKMTIFIAKLLISKILKERDQHNKHHNFNYIMI